jgi:Ca2+/Na+ antiporter
MWKRIVGWILICFGILGAISALTTNPINLLYESPAIALCILIGWLLVRRKKK